MNKNWSHGEHANPLFLRKSVHAIHLNQVLLVFLWFDRLVDACLGDQQNILPELLVVALDFLQSFKLKICARLCYFVIPLGSFNIL